MKKDITISRTIRRKRRVSREIMGTSDRPRIAVFRSNKYIYVQAIDDVARKTLASFSSQHLKKAKDAVKMKKAEEAKQVGVKLAGLLKEKSIAKGIFDRSVYAYLGRVKSLAEGLREGGLII
jgi:large subunit ribosomal protein L18